MGEAREREEGKHPIIANLTQDWLEFSTETYRCWRRKGNGGEVGLLF